MDAAAPRLGHPTLIGSAALTGPILLPNDPGCASVPHSHSTEISSPHQPLGNATIQCQAQVLTPTPAAVGGGQGRRSALRTGVLGGLTRAGRGRQLAAQHVTRTL